MQDGYIFSDSIANNIGLSDEIVDEHRVQEAARVANIDEYITSLPLGYKTRIGAEARHKPRTKTTNFACKSGI